MSKRPNIGSSFNFQLGKRRNEQQHTAEAEELLDCYHSFPPAPEYYLLNYRTFYAWKLGRGPRSPSKSRMSLRLRSRVPQHRAPPNTQALAGDPHEKRSD